MISTTTLMVRLQLVPRWLVLFGYIGAAVMLLTTGVLPAVDLDLPVVGAHPQRAHAEGTLRRPPEDTATEPDAIAPSLTPPIWAGSAPTSVLGGIRAVYGTIPAQIDHPVRDVQRSIADRIWVATHCG